MRNDNFGFSVPKSVGEEEKHKNTNAANVESKIQKQTSKNLNLLLMIIISFVPFDNSTFGCAYEPDDFIPFI